MSKYLSLVVTVVAAVAAGLAVLPYSWAGPVAGALAAGIEILHGSYFTTRTVATVRGNRGISKKV
jgi:hypothetical protein